MSELDAYDYDLPPELIAQHPLENRADARLLHLHRSSGVLALHHIRDLEQLLLPGDVLVLNDTRVVPARLVGRRAATGGKWTGLFLQESDGMWRVMSRTRGKLMPGEAILLVDRAGEDAWSLSMVSRTKDGSWIARPETDGQVFDLLQQVGRVPLPPYIRGGEMEDRDLERYQTVFARRPGAIAAPTAGLHLTQPMLRRLEARDDVSVVRVTLHVGEGTFKPVTAERLDDHVMHAEWGELTESVAATLRDARAAGGRIVAVGTTSVRVLESAAHDGTIRGWSGDTRLFIRPPYTFRAVDALLTNFHLPKSTLLMLVSAFAGREPIRRAYEAAIAERFRFFSYGDAMLIS